MGPRINERIRAREILVIDDTGNKLGIMSPREALDLARERGQDLIEVAPQAQPPVCRILDYGKFKYEQGKREREAAKKSRQSELKGMTLRPGTDDHDLEFKIKNIVKFLGDGDKVKVTVRFRSREMSHPEFARAALDKIVDAITEAAVGVVERPAIMEGRQMIMILAPAREGTAAAATLKKAVAAKSGPSAPAPGVGGAPAAAAPTPAAVDGTGTADAPAAAPAAPPAPVAEPVATAAPEPAAAA
jgi:translation initiation factor IF-3